MTYSAFWRVSARALAEESDTPPDDIAFDESLVRKIRVGNGFLLGDFDESENCAVVSFIGVVTAVTKDKSLIHVRWREKRLVLRPHPTGVRYWKRDRVFNFAREVSDRYLLGSIFAEEFQTVDWDSELVKRHSREHKSKTALSQTTKKLNQGINHVVSTTLDSSEYLPSTGFAHFEQEPEWVLKKRATHHKSGFVYLIQTVNGFKFQSSKSLPKWSLFFKFKVNFDVKLVHAAWFPDYIFAENELQARFHKNRYDGELLRLSEDQIRQIKAIGESIQRDLLE